MRNAYGWSLIAMIGVFSVASAQVRVQPRPAVQPRQPGAATAPAAGAAQTQGQGTPDQQLAACLWGGNHNEVELAKFAQQRAQSDSVKDFAAHMIKDHTQFADKLARSAGNLISANTARGGGDTAREVRKVPAEDTEEGARPAREEGARGVKEAPGQVRREGREEAREDRRTGREEAREDRREERTATTAAGRQAFNWVAIHKEIGEQCLQSSKKELERYKGAEFDKAYMGMQVAAHMEMLDKLKVFKNHASGQLQQDIEQGIETTQEHLKEAHKIMDEIKDEDNKSGKSEKRSSDREENK